MPLALKLITKIFTLTLLTLVFIVLLLTQKTNAAASCYLFYPGQNRYEAIACNDGQLGSQFTSLANAYFPGDNGLLSDHCYLLLHGTVGLEKAVQGSTKCNQWARGAAQQSSTAVARCHIFLGTVGEFEDRSFPLSQFQDFTGNRSCTSTQLSAIRSQFGEPQNGMCYVFFPNDPIRGGAIRRQNCVQLFNYVLGANNAHLNIISAPTNSGSWSFGGDNGSGHVCGGDDSATELRINIGCRGRGNAIIDMTFAFIRFLSAGVGIVIVASIVFAGIQFTAARGDPKNTADAINRIQNTLIAFGIYIFAYAILNWLIPAGLFGL